jgi:hypothetical protein
MTNGNNDRLESLRETMTGCTKLRGATTMWQLKNLIVQYRPSGIWSVTGGTGAAVDDFALAVAGAVVKVQE